MTKQHQHYCLILPAALQFTTDLQVATTELESRFKKLIKGKKFHSLHQNKSNQNIHEFVIFKRVASALNINYLTTNKQTMATMEGFF